MATPKKRDLRARLGRTITPKTGKGDADVAPPGAAEPEAPEAGAPPAAPAQAAAAAPAPQPPKPKPKVTPPPAGVTPPPVGVAAPPPGLGVSPSVGIAAPPFAQPAPAAPSGPADPFSAPAVVAQEKVVRLEFDDRLVQDAEVGKTQTFKIAIVAAVVLVLGLGVGFFGGSTYENRKIFDRTVRDAQSVYAAVNQASSTINAAQRHVNTIVAAAAGNESEGRAPAVDYDTITALRALEQPFDASAFTGKNYNAFSPDTVHDLFQYLMNVARLWGDFQALAAMTLAETAREELDRTAAETAQGASTMYGAVLTRNEDGVLVSSLAFVAPATGEGAEEGQFLARATRTGRALTLRNFQAAEGEVIEAGTPAFFVLVDGASSRGVLAEQTGAFGRFLMELRRIKPLVDQTVEIQGRLLTSISGALTEAGATVGPPPAEE